MIPKTPEENEELKILQYLESRPSLVARILGKLKRGKKEKPSLKKTLSSQETIKKAQAARWKRKTTVELGQSSSLDPLSEPKKPL